jgi:hypothetical protein
VGLLRRNAVRFAVQLRDVEVDREHKCQCDKCRWGEDRLPGDVAERHEQRGVDDEVGDRVEIATDERDLSTCARESAVRVVEQGLELEQQRRDDKVAGEQDDRRDEAGRCVRDNDDGRRDPGPRQRRGERVRERPEDDLEQELAPGPPRLVSRLGLTGCVLGRGGH